MGALWRTLAATLLLLRGAASAEDQERTADEEIDRLHLPDDSLGRYVVGRVVDALVPTMTTAAGARGGGGGLGDNELWRGLIGECARDASLSCVKRSVFGYLDRSMDVDGDLRVSDGVAFTRMDDAVFENKYARDLNNANSSSAENEVDGDGHRGGRSLDSFEGVADALYDKGVRFAMTHDLQLRLPEAVFGGGVLRISPRALEQDGGALLKVEVNRERKQVDEGRIFFKKHKDFKAKLMMSFMALLLVIKMISVKLIYLLPLLIGVGAAKKLLLKVLLFIFPAFSHLFKFCSTYHATHAGKFHHHHHQIAHHHHHIKVPVPVPVPVPAHHPAPAHTAEEGYPPSGHASWDAGATSSWDPPSAPGLDYAGSRSELATAAHHAEKELASWGLGHAGGDPANTYAANYGDTSGAASSTHALAYSAYAPTSAGEVRPASSNTQAPIYVTPQRKVYQRPAQDLRLQVQNLEVQQQQLVAMQQRQNAVQQKLQQLRVPQVQPQTARPGTTVAVAYDAFYSPILQRMDNVFAQLGFNEEACRERLVCSMYKAPARFSPHSNLVSAELSRDPSELQKPASPNSAVVRFYRYVQAARDGQDHKNCLVLYPSCTVNTELWRQ